MCNKTPKVLNKQLVKLNILSGYEIANYIEDIAYNGITVDMLVGNVANALLTLPEIQFINDETYEFKKSLLIRVKQVVNAMPLEWEHSNSIEIAKDGTMYTASHTTLISDKEKPTYNKEWFVEATEFQDNIVLKGSKKMIDNNSTSILQDKARIDLRIKEIDSKYIDLYVALLYADTHSKVEDSNYYTRLKEVAEETKLYGGYVYKNYRKLDSNSRNYPLSRFGFAVEYGDAFEKWLIEPAEEYMVTQADIDGAIEYLKDEFDIENVEQLVAHAKGSIEHNLDLLPKYNAGENIEFTIDHKQLGKYLHIVDIYENIICNKSGYSRSCASYDFTNSGGINAANQFGDEQFLKAMNLLGGEEKFDTHQEIANYFDIPRNDAKKVMQGPNHGGRVPEENLEMVTNVFGENYKYIRMIAEYGIEIAFAGITKVKLTRPDGVNAYWYSYSLDTVVPTEDGSSVSAIMPFNPNNRGTPKVSGLAVSILHSADSFTENYIQTRLYEEGIHIKTTLDNFYGRPIIKEKIIKYSFEAFEILRGYAEQQLKRIERQTGIERGWTLPVRNIELVPTANII